MSLVIKNAKILKDNKLTEADILIEDGTIKKVGHGLSGDEAINAKNLVCLPGLIDSHVHFREPGATQKEDFLSGSRAAAKGGITTILDMPNTKPPTSTPNALEEKRSLAKKSIVNYGFWFGTNGSNSNEFKQAKNIPGAKLYLGSTTGNMLVEDKTYITSMLNTARVAAVHAEDESIITRNTEKYKDSHDPSIHSKIRTPEAAEKSVSSTLALHKGTSSHLHICHTSTKNETRLISQAKSTGQSVSMEVCPHHLFLNDSCYKELLNRAKMNPPLRSKHHVAALWKAIQEGTVDSIATDHAPHLPKEKDQDYWNAPAGVPGVQTLLPLMLHAVNENRISLRRVVELCCKNPAALFNMKKKGTLAPGFDADLILVDMKRQGVIRDEDQLSKCGWTPYDGWKVKGMPVTTLVKGKVVAENDSVSKKSPSNEVQFS